MPSTKIFSTLNDLVRSSAARGDAAALIALGSTGTRIWSYRELVQSIAQLAAGLRRAGLERGEPVLLLGPNSPEWVATYFAIIGAGGMAVPLDDLSDTHEVARVLADSGSRRVFTTQSHVSTVREFDRTLDVISLDEGGDDGTSWQNILAEDVAELPNIEADDVASLLYTSGTTGTPKSVPLTHRNFQSNVTAMVTENPVGAEDRILLPLPLHHAYPFTVGLLGAIASGATLVFPAGISGPQIANAIKEAKATVLIGVPRLYAALVDGISNTVASHGAAAVTTFKYLLNFSIWLRRTTGKRIGRVLFRRLHARLGPDLRLLCSGGARLDPGLELTLEALGWQVLTGYGLTETAPILTINPPGKSRLDSAGLPVPGVELRCDGVGAEILVRGPNVFAGYRNNPEATRDAFTSDGWFRTGDLGFVDRDGYLHITGRAKEVIVLSDGKNVNPEDVETSYLEGAFIREFAVLEQDQALAALVVPDDDAVRKYGAAREEDLLREEIEAISRRLPSYKRVATYRVTRTRLPRTNLGKLRRHLLPNIYAAAVAGSDRVSELTEDDRRLLAAEPAKSVWHWLQNRFHGKHLTLETSPQFDLHVDSLEWVALTLEIQEHFGIALDEATVGRVVTLRDLLNEVCAAERNAVDQPANIGELTDEEAKWLSQTGVLMTLLGITQFWMSWFAMRVILRLRIKGAENLPNNGPFVITPNHASYLDSLAVCAALGLRRMRQTYWVGWAKLLFRGPIRRLLSRAAHILPIDPDRGPARGLAFGAAAIQREKILVWYPEGGLSPTGELGRFLPGIGSLVANTTLEIVPVLIEGTFEAMPRGLRWPKFRQITITFGRPRTADDLESHGQGGSTNQRIANGLQDAVASLRNQ